MKHSLVALLCALAVAGCDRIPPAEFFIDGSTLDVRGTINTRFVDDLEAQLEQHPSIDTLRLVNIPGSVDDDATLLRLVSLIRSNELATLVPSDGVVASGGTDMVLMGVERRVEPGACVGVHTWGSANGETGATLPKDADQHQLYFDFYEIVDVPIDFYWFTLRAAGPDEIYWMSSRDLNRFEITTEPLPSGASETDVERQERCDRRP